MKIIFATLLSVLTIFPAFSGKYRATGIDKVDKFKLELGWEIPIKAESVEDAVRFNIGGNWKLASGILRTKSFGRNGAIDYGFLYSLLYYYGNRYNTDIWREHVVMKERDAQFDPIEPSFFRHRLAFRAAFHYQFLKNLDTYIGFFGGFGLVKPQFIYEEEYIKAKSYVEGSWGLRSGATWYFNDCFGMGVEWEDDLYSYYGINGSGNTLNLKFQYLFSEKAQRERAIKKKQKDMESLRKDQEELEKWILEE